MTKRRKSMCIRCDGCDQLHMAHYDRDVATAVGPTPTWISECPVTGMRFAYIAEDEVVLP